MSAVAARLREVVTVSARETRDLARRLAAAAVPGDVIGLVGELGAGKTQFAKGFAAGLGVAATVNSPSFVLMAEYEGRLPFFHLDLFRLSGAEEAIASGLLDERQAGGVTVVEWADRLEAVLPEARLAVTIVGTGDAARRIRLVAGAATYERYLAALDVAA